MYHNFPCFYALRPRTGVHFNKRFDHAARQHIIDNEGARCDGTGLAYSCHSLRSFLLGVECDRR
jgi:hypothetical protein